MCDQGQKSLPYQNLIMHTSSSMTVLYLALLYVFKCHIQYQCAFCVFAEEKKPNKTPKNLTPLSPPIKKTPNKTQHNPHNKTPKFFYNFKFCIFSLVIQTD